MIIGFAGRKQSGKSTAASALVQLGYAKHSFADPLRAMADSLLGGVRFDAGGNRRLSYREGSCDSSYRSVDSAFVANPGHRLGQDADRFGRVGEV